MNEQGYPSAKKYHAIKNRLFFSSLFLNLLFLAIFFLSGFSVYLRAQAGSFSNNLFLLNGFYILAFFIIFNILNFPLSLYEGFILEHKFNLSNQNFLGWLKDDFKRVILELILFLILVEAVYFLLHKNPDYWWLFGALFWIFLTLILAKITPAIIIPIFYKYIPIADSQLRQRIFDLFERCRIKISDVTSINFSQKTKKANAFVAGLGKNKKVVLSDTLLEKFSLDEIEAVLTHELGHYLNHDILKLILVNSTFTVMGFYITDKLLNNLLSAFGLKAIDDIAFLPILSLSLIILGFMILPLQNGFSRFLEKKADIFSLRLTKNKGAFISMMDKLGKINLADVSPSRFIEIWFYNHPPISKRIKFAQNSKLIITMAIFFLFAGATFASESPRYEIDCRLSIEKHQLSAKEKTTFVNNSNNKLNEVFFHIYPHRKYTNEEKEFMLRFAGYFKVNPFPAGFVSGDLKIKSIKDGSGAPLDYSVEGEDQTILKVNLLKPLAPKEGVELVLDFEVDIPHSYGRFSWHENITVLTRWYPMLSVLDKEGWHNHPFYPFHQPFFSDAAFYKVKLTLPKGQVVIHTGVLKGENQGPSPEKTLIIETDLPVRDFSFAISGDYKVLTNAQDNVKISSYYLKGDEFYAQKALEYASDLMKNYAKNFGSYPYKEFNIAPAYLAYGADQSSNLILIDTRCYKLPRFLIRYFDFLISHETGHQWFYNIVGSDEYKEMWLDEGLNSYFILNYLEEKYGKDAFVMELPNYIKWLIPNFTFRRARDIRYIFLAKNGWDSPILSKLSSFKEPSSIFALTYGKGARVLSMLNSLVGHEIFSKIFQRYFQEFKFRNIKVTDFERIANDESKKDLTWFFDEWLRTDKKCDYAVKEVKKNKVVLENRGSIEMPVKTEIEFSDGSRAIDNWDGKGKIREINIANNLSVKEVELDRELALLDIDRTNNFWPRNLYKKLVALYFGAYETPVFLPDDSYNLVFGPDLTHGIGMKASLQKPFDDIVYLSSGYDINGEQIKSSLGYEHKHVLDKQLAVGAELFNNKDLDGHTEDLYGGKLYLRYDLWPASYGLTEVNDHISFYVLRNRRFDGGTTLGGLEDIRNLSYLRNDEAILGATFYLNRSGPYFNPEAGYKLSATVENAEHFLGGKEYYWREMFDTEFYKSVFKDTQLATRIKFGWGTPNDKNLYQLGGYEGLRGFDLKTIRGARTMLGSLEYRFPLRKNLNYRFFDNILGIDELQGVLFFDVGKSWFKDFDSAKFKKDAGLGLRIHLNIASFLEKAVLRLDVAQAIDNPKEKAHVWVGINQAF